jgi:hypothetical protein
LKIENVSLHRELQLLKSVVVNLYRKVTQQEEEIVDLRGRSMRDIYILIHNLTEEENENLDTKVRKLISDHLQLEISFRQNSSQRTSSSKLETLNHHWKITTTQ